MIQSGPPLSRAPLGTPPDSPSLSTSTPFTLNDAQQFIDLVKAVVTMHTMPNGLNQTPLNSPTLQVSSPPVTLEHLKQLFLEVIQATSKPQISPKAVKSDAKGGAEPKEEIARASKLEFKTVNEVYVSNNV